MADLPAKAAFSGLQLDRGNLSSKEGLPTTGAPPTQPGAGAGKDRAFNAALAEGNPSNTASAKGLDATQRSSSADRTGTPPTVIGRSEGLNVGKLDLPVLQLGSSDRAVGLLQRALATLGFLAQRQDGVFGSQTDQAVRSFQEGCGLKKDGVVGNRETWPTMNQALVTRHEGVTRLADAMSPMRGMAEPQLAEMRQLGAVLAEFGERVAPPAAAKETAVPLALTERQAGGDVIYTARGGETLFDVARTFGLPVSALIAANPELSRPYLILQGQLLTVPNPVKERAFRRPPRQLHPADPEGYLASANMNPDFVDLVNGMITQLRGEGHDVRVIAGFRSFAEQQQRFEQGRHSPGRKMTDAEAGHSWHNYGLAVDIVLNDDDGSPAWPEDSALFWQRLGDVALAHGAIWGGLFGYPAHVEYHPQFEHDEAGVLIEDFESHGLEAVWERIALELPPEV